MRLTVVGCSGSVPGPDSPSSCYLVEHEGYHVLLDLGHGAFGALQRHLDPGTVDAVLLSHLHADHWADLKALDVWRHYGPGDATRPFEVRGPSGGYVAEATTWAPVQEVGPFRVLTARVEHPVEAYAVRLEAGGSTLVYSGDSARCEPLDDLASGADVLLAEATYVDGRDNPPLLHLTGREAGQTAERAGVGRLVVTHVPPWESWERAVADAGTTYSGAVLQAAPGLALEF